MATKPPSLADALADAAVDTRQRGQVDALLDSMSESDAELLRKALHGPLSARRIKIALEAVGHTVGVNAIDGWRQRNGAR